MAFFSGTDTDELLTNCKNFNYYISLIVNFSKDYKCKIAFPSKTVTKKTFTFKNGKGELVKANSSVEEDNVIVGELSIEFEDSVPTEQWLIERTSVLKKKKEEASKPKPVVYNTTIPSTKYGGWNNPNYVRYGEDDWNDFPQPASKFVTIKQFLQALIALNVEDKNTSIQQTLNQLAEEGIDIVTYENVLGEAIDVIHDDLYGDHLLFKYHCKSAIEELEKNQHLFVENEDVYVTIQNTLSLYATV